MTTIFKLSTLFLACSIVLTGCGGGGGSSDNNSGSANNSNTGGNNTNQVSAGSQTGVLLDSPVAGVTYTTSSGYTGTTDSSGHYSYNTGDTITFKLGTLTLGTVPASGLITPIDLANSNTNTSIQTNTQNNLLVLLQSLDTHANTNTITITPASIANITSSLDLTVDPTTFATKLQTLSITPVPLATALTNFQTALSTNSSTSTTPLQTAKKFVNDANTIIASATQILQTYQPANLTGTTELSYATYAFTALTLNAYQAANAVNAQPVTLTPAQIQAALGNTVGNGYTTGSNVQYSNLQNLTVTTTAPGIVNISGNFTITYMTGYSYNPTTKIFTPIYSAPITVNLSQFSTLTNANVSQTNQHFFTLKANSSINVTTAAGVNATVVANSDSTVTANYPTPAALNLSSALTSSLPTPQTGTISLQNLKFTSGVTTLNLNNLNISGQEVNVQNSGSNIVQLTFVPTSLTFNGSLQQNQSTANVSAQIQLSPLSSSTTYTLDSNGIPTAGAAAGTTANFSLAVNSNIFVGSTPHAFNANFIGSLTGVSSVQSAIELSLDKTTLMGSITATAPTSTQPATLAATLIDPNGASVNIPNVRNFTTANILVNGTTQGTISQTTNSIYQAKFTDNAIIVIAP